MRTSKVAILCSGVNYQARDVWKPLPDARNDVQLLEARFLKEGFCTIYHHDAASEDVHNCVREASRVIDAKTDAVVFHWSGHAVERGGRTVLIPIDVGSGKHNGIDLNGLLQSLVCRASPSTIVLVTLDCCRSEEGPGREESMVIPRNRQFVIIFANRPGLPARGSVDDGCGHLTRALLDNLFDDKSLYAIFESIRVDVRRRTSGLQEPWLASSCGHLCRQTTINPILTSSRRVEMLRLEKSEMEARIARIEAERDLINEDLSREQRRHHDHHHLSLDPPQVEALFTARGEQHAITSDVGVADGPDDRQAGTMHDAVNMVHTIGHPQVEVRREARFHSLATSLPEDIDIIGNYWSQLTFVCMSFLHACACLLSCFNLIKPQWMSRITFMPWIISFFGASFCFSEADLGQSCGSRIAVSLHRNWSKIERFTILSGIPSAWCVSACREAFIYRNATSAGKYVVLVFGWLSAGRFMVYRISEWRALSPMVAKRRAVKLWSSVLVLSVAARWQSSLSLLTAAEGTKELVTVGLLGHQLSVLLFLVALHLTAVFDCDPRCQHSGGSLIQLNILFAVIMKTAPLFGHVHDGLGDFFSSRTGIAWHLSGDVIIFMYAVCLSSCLQDRARHTQADLALACNVQS